MAIGRPIPPLSLSPAEHETLERWARRPTTAQALALRARILLACGAGETNTAVAEELSVTKPTVGKWRARFIGRRLDGLLDEPPARSTASDQRRRRGACGDPDP